MARLAYPRPVRSRTRRRSADQVRATGRPTALRGAVTRPSPDGYSKPSIREDPNPLTLGLGSQAACNRSKPLCKATGRQVGYSARTSPSDGGSGSGDRGASPRPLGEHARAISAIDAASDGALRPGMEAHYFAVLPGSVAGVSDPGRHPPPWAWVAIRCLVTAMAASATLLPWTFAMIAAFSPVISSTLFAARYSAEALRLRVCPLISGMT